MDFFGFVFLFSQISFREFVRFIKNLSPSHLRAVQTDIELGLRKARLIAGDGTEDEKRERLEKCPISLVVEGDAFSVLFPSVSRRPHGNGSDSHSSSSSSSRRAPLWRSSFQGSPHNASGIPHHDDDMDDDYGSPEVLLLRAMFFELASMAKSVICCRLTPSQKGRIVEEFVRKGHVTLAIGDGGNDECLSLDTPVLRADGVCVRADCVKQGMSLQGTTGPVTVISQPVIGHGRMYRVTAADGRSFVVSAGHLVTLVWCRGTTVRLTDANACGYRLMHVRWWDAVTLTQKQQTFRTRLAHQPDPSTHPSNKQYVVHASYEDALEARNEWVARNNPDGKWNTCDRLDIENGRICTSLRLTVNGVKTAVKVGGTSFSWVIPGRAWAPLPIVRDSDAGLIQYGWDWLHSRFGVDRELTSTANATRVVPAFWRATSLPFDSDFPVELGPSSEQEKHEGDTDEGEVDFQVALPAHLPVSVQPRPLPSPLELGDFIEIRAEDLAAKELMQHLKGYELDGGSDLAVLQMICSASPLRSDATSSSPSASSLSMSMNFARVVSAAKSVGEGPVCAEFVQFAVGPKDWRPANSDDTLRLCLFLDHPLQQRSLLHAQNEKAVTIVNLEDAHLLLQSPLSQADGVFISHLNLVCSAIGEMNSTLDKYNTVCIESMNAVLSTGVTAIVAFGKYASDRWRMHAANGTLIGVNSTRSFFDGVNQVWCSMIQMNDGRTVGIFYAPHPCMRSKLAHIARAIRAAREHAGFPVGSMDEFDFMVDQYLSNDPCLLRIDSVQASNDTVHVGWEVDGDKRFVLGNRIITHNCMIRKANVGVGIQGLEGTAAARAADYSIASFRFLHTLIFVHGYWNYRRNSKLVLFIFHKSAMIAFGAHTH
jgi:hypothetical protein